MRRRRRKDREKAVNVIARLPEAVYHTGNLVRAPGGVPGNESSRERRPMHTTSASLLHRLRQPSDKESWPRFVKLYTPLLFYWARRLGLQEPDAADLVQDVFTALVQKLPQFEYDPDRGFRSWL